MFLVAGDLEKKNQFVDFMWTVVVTLLSYKHNQILNETRMGILL